MTWGEALSKSHIFSFSPFFNEPGSPPQAYESADAELERLRVQLGEELAHVYYQTDVDEFMEAKVPSSLIPNHQPSAFSSEP